MTSPSFDPSALAGNILAAFASPFTQARCILKFALAHGNGIAPDTLLAHRVIAHEAINDSYRITVEALSADNRETDQAFLTRPLPMRLRHGTARHSHRPRIAGARSATKTNLTT